MPERMSRNTPVVSRLPAAANRARVFAVDVMKVSIAVGRFVLDTSVQFAEMGRKAGVPMSKPYAERIIQAHQEQEDRHQETTLFMLTSIYLEARKRELRGAEYFTTSEQVLEFVRGYAAEKGIDTERVMEEHIGPLEGRVMVPPPIEPVQN
jgi:hypothetical protein